MIARFIGGLGLRKPAQERPDDLMGRHAVDTFRPLMVRLIRAVVLDSHVLITHIVNNME